MESLISKRGPVSTRGLDTRIYLFEMGLLMRFISMYMHSQG